MQIIFIYPVQTLIMAMISFVFFSWIIHEKNTKEVIAVHSVYRVI